MAVHPGPLAGQNGTLGTNASPPGPERPAAPAPAAGNDERILTSREARAYLRIGRTKLHELTRRQVIPAYRIGEGKTSSLRYLRSDLLGWLVRQRVSR
ncbi:MAG TPA: helix-turn-helix domain-containing protein [Candidatus Polarisedimenticolia bacterium]|nr:helix-turn-helix domain-containing protein [Candidatus Polarisedimenticolia bacterium]